MKSQCYTGVLIILNTSNGGKFQLCSTFPTNTANKIASCYHSIQVIRRNCHMTLITSALSGHCGLNPKCCSVLWCPCRPHATFSKHHRATSAAIGIFWCMMIGAWKGSQGRGRHRAWGSDPKKGHQSALNGDGSMAVASHPMEILETLLTSNLRSRLRTQYCRIQGYLRMYRRQVQNVKRQCVTGRIPHARNACKVTESNVQFAEVRKTMITELGQKNSCLSWCKFTNTQGDRCVWQPIIRLGIENGAWNGEKMKPERYIRQELRQPGTAAPVFCAAVRKGNSNHYRRERRRKKKKKTLSKLLRNMLLFLVTCTLWKQSYEKEKKKTLNKILRILDNALHPLHNTPAKQKSSSGRLI